MTDNTAAADIAIELFVDLLGGLLLHSQRPLTELALLKHLRQPQTWQDANTLNRRIEDTDIHIDSLRPIEAVFLQSNMADTYALFQKHFLLMHALYRLQARWMASRRAQLSISPLSISVEPWREEGELGLSKDFEQQRLRDYYLDISQLERESAASVEGMLGDFWQRYGEHRAVDAQAALAAFKTLGFDQPVEAKILRQRYRTLAQQHHPDRGGKPERFVELQQAYEDAMASIKK